MTGNLPRDIDSTRATFNQIAEDFDRTRSYAWSAVSMFIEEEPTVEVAIDIGCGNGRHSELFIEQDTSVIGLDLSRKLLEHAVARVASSRFLPVEGTATNLPVSDSMIDRGIYIATIHHLPTRSDRIVSLDELARVLKPNGVALISGWSVHDDRFDEQAAFDTVIDWTLPSGETIPRFYHLYDEQDFAGELEESNLSIERQWRESGNCYASVTVAPE